MGKVSKVIIGLLAGVGAATTVIKTMELMDYILYPNEKQRVDDINKNIIEVIDIKEVVTVEDKEVHNINQTNTVDNVDDLDIDRAWNMQELSRMIIDFIIKNKNLDIKELQKKAKADYDELVNSYKVEKIYGDEPNQLVEDYLIFLQIMKDKKIKNTKGVH